jgi:hypothetical protein
MFAVLRKLRSNEAIRGIIDFESAQHEKIDGLISMKQCNKWKQ